MHDASSSSRAERIALWLFLALFGFGLLLRVIEVWRPIDASSHYGWREADVGMIARNFWRGDMNILKPQIDWAGDGPGYVESEFPLLAWAMALGYRLFGYHEQIGRLIAAGISLASLWVFHRIASRLLGPWPRRIALLLFALNPIVVGFAANLQPDGGMLLGVLLAVDRWLAWRETSRTRDLLAGALLAALAIALKGPAVYLAPFLALLALEKYGVGCLRRAELWLAGALMVLPPLAWYLHAHRFVVLYGNSLGVSNQHHWIGLDMVRNPAFLAERLFSLARREIRFALCFGGVLALPFALPRLDRNGRPVLAWLGSALLFYLAALRTTADNWAYYYHALSVPPFCLLMAMGTPVWSDVGAGWERIPARFRGLVNVMAGVALLLTLGASLRLATRGVDFSRPGRGEGPEAWAMYRAAQAFQPRIEPDARVVVLNDNFSADERGLPIADDDGRMLFWLDRKGFTLAQDEQSVERLLALKQRGARYFTCRLDLPIAQDLPSRFTVLARADNLILGRL